MDPTEAVNHALAVRSCFIHQTWEPVSLEFKDTEVRAYRTDPVQVVERAMKAYAGPRVDVPRIGERKSVLFSSIGGINNAGTESKDSTSSICLKTFWVGLGFLGLVQPKLHPTALKARWTLRQVSVSTLDIEMLCTKHCVLTTTTQ
ncbi:hypothetical protein Acr_00g0027960 [Actinidia rufa]|uniref:Uncharacterized protein n=1 Tax=Actinidia rufa TaxID=165716 RepID=A0A7J0DE50_9ERIC|nr:hypothetical protein Acr_00g0027960 [Actinidia rufa]